MRWRGIIVTGTSGAGKSTLTGMLRAHNPAFEQVKAVTTREPRPDDGPGAYEYLTGEGFDGLRLPNHLGRVPGKAVRHHAHSCRRSGGPGQVAGACHHAQIAR